MKTELFIFDMDGLMFDSERVYTEFQKKSLEDAGIPYDEGAIIDAIGSINPLDYHRLNRSDFPDEEVAKIVDTGWYRAVDHLTSVEVPLKDGLIELLDRLKKDGRKCCVVSSTKQPTVEKMIENAGLASYFSFYVTGSDISHSKPSPDIFNKALELSGISADQALVLEDSANGLRASCNARISCIIIPDQVQPDKWTIAHARLILPSLRQVLERYENGEFD